MGNANSSSSGPGSRDRHKSGEMPPSSPSCKEGQAFTFEKRPVTSQGQHQKIILQHSNEEDDQPYYHAKPNASPSENQEDYPDGIRKRANTVSEGTKIPGITHSTHTSKILPTVFKWEGGGKQVMISGSFSNWKTIPMVKSHGDFVTSNLQKENMHINIILMVNGERSG